MTWDCVDPTEDQIQDLIKDEAWKWQVTNCELPEDLKDRVEIVVDLDLDLYRSRSADAYGRPLAANAHHAELLMLRFFLPRLRKHKTWHLCGYDHLENFFGLTRKEVRNAIEFLSNKGHITCVKRQYSFVDEHGKRRTRAAVWMVNRELVTHEPRRIGDADEAAVSFTYADGRTVQVPLSEIGPLDQPIIVNRKAINLLAELKRRIREPDISLEDLEALLISGEFE